MNKDNYLVTGASGLVGFPLVNKLLDKECFVVGIDPIQREEKKNYEHVTLINHDVEEIIEVLKKYSITKVIHTGAVSGPMLYNDKPNFIIENKSLKLIHIHRNNWKDIDTDGNPNDVELTFVNIDKINVTNEKSEKNYPIPGIDYKNFKRKNDIQLNFHE